MGAQNNTMTTWVAVALALATALPVVVAGTNPFTGNGTQPPVNYQILWPGICSSCHAGYDSGHNVRPTTTWAGSMMANAGRDPIFWAALDVANNDVPGIGEWCLRCHSPTGWLSGRAAAPTGSGDGCSLAGEIDGTDNDFEGLSCSFCHRMQPNPSPPVGQQSIYYENGQYWIDDTSCPNGFEPCRHGPYNYDMGQAQPPHTWVHSQYHEDSDNCGNCHNVTNPILTLIDENGVDTGVPVPVERTYLEWEQSSFSQPGPGYATCQNCHMPDATHDPAYPSIAVENNRTGDLPIHELVGGNAWVPQVLKGEYPNVGRADEYDATTAWALEMLSESTTVELSVPSSAQAGADLDIGVRVTNHSGHKLPTGYPEGRRMWLDVVVRADGTPIWQSGAWDPVTGALADDPQLKVYEVKPGIWNHNGSNECDTTDIDGNPLFHFALNDCIALDNRIPPEGFTGINDIETRPVNYSYPETAPGSGILVNYDETTYSVPIPGSAAGAQISVEAALRYQTASDDYILFLHDQAVDHGFPDDCIPRSDGLPDMSRGEILYDMWTRYDRAPPVPMAVENAMIDVALFVDGFETGDTNAWSAATP